MKLNRATKLIVILLVYCGSNFAASIVNKAGEKTISVSNTSSAALPKMPTRHTLTTLQQPTPRTTEIVATPANLRDMSGETLYALPYEETKETRPFSTTPVGRGMIGEPRYVPPVTEETTKRPGIMYTW